MCKKTELFQAWLLWSVLHLSKHQERQRVCKTFEQRLKPTKTYSWNTSEDSFLDYQQKYCEMRCQGDERIIHRETACWNIECVQCHCERPACEHYHVCCPDISAPFERRGVVAIYSSERHSEVPLNNSEPAYRKRSATPNLGCEYHPGLDHRFLFIRSCQADYDVNQTVIDLCEMDRQPHEQTIETFIKVVDLERQIVYRNKFCALCNHVTNVSI
ncbi:hypothetical protein BgiBS90_005214 [Biomphalaria glabrata]|nr:hypothetical protein BgiBS90_005214 [Biomphalaria glabrata]